jgi:hypothetical protein
VPSKIESHSKKEGIITSFRHCHAKTENGDAGQRQGAQQTTAARQYWKARQGKYTGRRKIHPI